MLNACLKKFKLLMSSKKNKQKKNVYLFILQRKRRGKMFYFVENFTVICRFRKQSGGIRDLIFINSTCVGTTYLNKRRKVQDLLPEHLR